MQTNESPASVSALDRAAFESCDLGAFNATNLVFAQVDPFAEWRACDALKKPAIDALTGRGVPVLALARDWDDWGFALAQARVVFLANDTFEFARDLPDASTAEMVIIIAARGADGQVCDLAAWQPCGMRAALWLSRAAMLGEQNLAAIRMAEPVIAHETILDWLKGERRGIVILDTGRARNPIHEAGAPIAVENESYGHFLQKALAIPAPQILVRKNAERRTS